MTTSTNRAIAGHEKYGAHPVQDETIDREAARLADAWAELTRILTQRAKTDPTVRAALSALASRYPRRDDR